MTTTITTRRQKTERAAEWLRSCGHTVVGICTLHIHVGNGGKPCHESFPAVKYLTADDSHVRYYVLSHRPYLRRTNQTCFIVGPDAHVNVNGDTYFIATYTENEHPEHSPFGPAYVLCKWTSDEAIDAHRPRNHKPHDRVPLTESPHVLTNLSMERMLVVGSCIDLSGCDRNTDGDYILRGDIREKAKRKTGFVFCDAKTESWIGSIGVGGRSGDVLASVSGKFYKHSEYVCLFLR